jgi:hypothetical protein
VLWTLLLNAKECERRTLVLLAFGALPICEKRESTMPVDKASNRRSTLGQTNSTDRFAERHPLLPVKDAASFLGGISKSWLNKARPSGSTWPTMLALVTSGTDTEPTAIHRTFLWLNGDHKPPVTPQKMMLGPCCRGVVRIRGKPLARRAIRINGKRGHPEMSSILAGPTHAQMASAGAGKGLGRSGEGPPICFGIAIGALL